MEELVSILYFLISYCHESRVKMREILLLRSSGVQLIRKCSLQCVGRSNAGSFEMQDVFAPYIELYFYSLTLDNC